MHGSLGFIYTYFITVNFLLLQSTLASLAWRTMIATPLPVDFIKTNLSFTIAYQEFPADGHISPVPITEREYGVTS
jgi:hypothetical protein